MDMNFVQLKENLTKRFYDSSKHEAMFLFGSTAKKNRTSSSDIDLIILTKNTTRFTHLVKELDGKTYDIFEMPVELAYHHLLQRDEMWVHSFSISILLTGNPQSTKIIELAKELALEPRRLPSEEEERKLVFACKYKFQKLQRYTTEEVLFNFTKFDFIESLYNILHARHQVAPKMGSRTEKLQRLTNDFGKESSLIEKLVLSTSTIESIKISQQILDLLNIKDSAKPLSHTVFDVDVSDQMKAILSQM